MGSVVGSLIFVHAIVGLVQQRLHDAAFIIGGDRPTVGVAERKLIAVTVCSVGFPAQTVQYALHLLPVRMVNDRHKFVAAVSAHEMLSGITRRKSRAKLRISWSPAE